MLELKNITKVYEAGTTQVEALKGINIAFRDRREQIVDTLKVNQCRVSSLTVGNPLSVFHHMLVAVAKVKRVAIASFHFHRTLLSAVGWRTFLSAQEKYVKMNPLRL